MQQSEQSAGDLGMGDRSSMPQHDVNANFKKDIIQLGGIQKPQGKTLLHDDPPKWERLKGMTGGWVHVSTKCSIEKGIQTAEIHHGLV